ncbi:MAG TPA: hypothetical protein VFP12_05145 [Allosphingosinicella sp.]|nr:hypothetical protein [Allosphingosinicella sp.]
MTGSAPVLDRPALWAALSHMQIDLPGTATRFEEALAEQQGWTLDFAQRVTDEYCGFLYLAATAGSEVTPSQAVDEAWHLHLTSPHYREALCERILGRPLDHYPGTGEPEDEARYRRQYEETLALYERVFGKTPPRDIWPRPGLAGEDEEPPSGWERRRRVNRRLAFASLAGGVAALPFAPAAVGITLVAAALFFFLLSQPANAARGGSSAGCGGTCGGGSASSGDGCGASCGGGGCGGGCGGD